MAYYPLFFDLTHQSILIIGGGTTAFEKAKRLAFTKAFIEVIAKDFSQDFSSLPLQALKQRAWKESDLVDRFLVIAATNQKEENAKIAQACKQAHVLCNVVDDAKLSTTVFGAVIYEEKLSIGISTSGASPSGAIYLKNQIQNQIPQQFDAILEWLSWKRAELKAKLDPAIRSLFFKALFDACIQKGEPLSEPEVQALLKQFNL